MTTFAYTAVEPSGKKQSGFLEAASQEAAVATLTADGRYVLEIKAQKQVSQTKATGQKKATRQDIALFTRRMADLASAGLPLDRVLQVIGEQSESPQLAAIAEQALEDVRSGLPVSAALSKFPKQFPSVYTETLKAGEASGQFSEVAGKLADFQENELARRSQIVAALIYPSILAVVAVLVVVFLFTFVIPRLSGVFDSLGNELPTTTKILLGIADFLTSNGTVILGGLIGAFLLYRGWIATEAGALARDSFLLRAPVLGKVISKAVVSRFSRVLGTLVYGGVPILEALTLAGMASGNRLFVKTSRLVADDVRDGKAIHQSMRDTGSFPPVLVHMVAIGEETGDLPKMLGRVSDSLDFEVDVSMRRISAMVEPIVVVAMGVIVGFVILSVLLPIVQAQDLVK
ncbi:MAG: type II secretion system F family protein [Fimbriimonadaceae bacterium]|nr:type II secretion system F family protein [Fimbriimonadaceae bacterium]